MAKAKKTNRADTLKKVYLAALGAVALSIDIAKGFYQKSIERGASVEKDLNNSISQIKEGVETFISETTEKVKGQIERGLETVGIVAQKSQGKAKA